MSLDSGRIMVVIMISMKETGNTTDKINHISLYGKLNYKQMFVLILSQSSIKWMKLRKELRTIFIMEHLS